MTIDDKHLYILIFKKNDFISCDILKDFNPVNSKLSPIFATFLYFSSLEIKQKK
jgi:hypothetical protein